MKPPKCKICGTEHWAREPHARSAAAGKPVVIDVAPSPRSKTPAKPKVSEADEPKKKRGRPRIDGPGLGKSPRAEYQRELMRKRRAKQREKH